MEMFFKGFLGIGDNQARGNKAHGFSFGASETALLLPLGPHSFWCSSGLHRVATEVVQNAFLGPGEEKPWQGREGQGSGTWSLGRTRHPCRAAAGH